MSKRRVKVCRQTAYARQKSDDLKRSMGGKCALCGDTGELEFDHPQGRTYAASKLSYSARIARYAMEAKVGLLRLLCAACNKATRKTDDNGRHVPTSSTEIERTGEIPY